MDHGCRRMAAFAGLAWLALMACSAPAETVAMGLAAAFAVPAWPGVEGFLGRAGAGLAMCMGAALSSQTYRLVPALVLTPVALAAVHRTWLAAAAKERDTRITDPSRLLPPPRRTVDEWLDEMRAGKR